MTPQQCRMARAAIKMTTLQLAEQAGVTQTTLNRFENGKDFYQSTADKLEKALLSTGKVRFEGDKCVCLCGSE